MAAPGVVYMQPKISGGRREYKEEEENIYDRDVREMLLADDELRYEEEAFMHGYEEGFPESRDEDDDEDVEWSEPALGTI